MIYFTADLHLGHENIIKHCNRPFGSADKMDETIIWNWNNTVRRNDEIYILGDFTMKPADEAHRYIMRLNGRKYFICGNHDKFLNGTGFDKYAGDFVWIKDYYVLKCDGRKFILFHYPIVEWDSFFRDAIHLYGHIHNSELSFQRVNAISGLLFNVGVDCHDFKPVSLDKIIEMSANIPQGVLLRDKNDEE